MDYRNEMPLISHLWLLQLLLLNEVFKVDCFWLSVFIMKIIFFTLQAMWVNFSAHQNGYLILLAASWWKQRRALSTCLVLIRIRMWL